MKKIWVWFGIFLCAFSFAVDTTTIPIQDKFDGPKGSEAGSLIAPKGKAQLSDERTETIPLSVKKNMNSDSGAPVAGKQPVPGKPSPAETEAKPYVASVETYGSTRINHVVLKEVLGSDLDKWIQKGLSGAPDSIQVEGQLAEKVKNKFGFADVSVEVVQYFDDDGLPLHITFNVVEPQDVARRMPFKAPPTAELKFPKKEEVMKVVKAWVEYEDIAMTLVEEGQLVPDAEQCNAYHCPFGHKHEKLKKYEKIFMDGVKKYSKELVKVLDEEPNGEYRGAAVYVLAYQKDGKKLANQLLPHLKDSSHVVRNNVLRVLGEMAEFHSEIPIPVKPVLEALDYPRVSDRAKSTFLAYLLCLSSNIARDEILKTSVPTLLKLIVSNQPDEKEFSHSILRKISGKEFPVTDVQAWNNWYAKLPKNRVVTGTK